jgi:hypothetical protein
MFLWHLADALNEGKKLVNSETWKKSAIAVQVLTAFIAAIFAMIPALSDIAPDLVKALAVGIFSVFQVYSHVATTESLGFKK